MDDAKRIYRREYWIASGSDRLPPPWDLIVFDAAVNMGIFPGVQFMQKAVGVEPDGRVGPVTIAACMKAGKEQLALALAYRAMRYAQIRGFERFGRGWLKRTYLIAMECG